MPNDAFLLVLPVLIRYYNYAVIKDKSSVNALLLLCNVATAPSVMRETAHATLYCNAPAG
jgi:hypothetical protein